MCCNCSRLHALLDDRCLIMLPQCVHRCYFESQHSTDSQALQMCSVICAVTVWPIVQSLSSVYRIVLQIDVSTTLLCSVLSCSQLSDHELFSNAG